MAEPMTLEEAVKTLRESHVEMEANAGYVCSCSHECPCPERAAIDAVLAGLEEWPKKWNATLDREARWVEKLRSAERERDEARREASEHESRANRWMVQAQHAEADAKDLGEKGARISSKLAQAEARAEEYHRSLVEAMKVIHEEQARAERLREALESLLVLAEWQRKRVGVEMGMPNSGAIQAARAALSEEER